MIPGIVSSVLSTAVQQQYQVYNTGFTTQRGGTHKPVGKYVTGCVSSKVKQGGKRGLSSDARAIAPTGTVVISCQSRQLLAKFDKKLLSCQGAVSCLFTGRCVRSGSRQQSMMRKAPEKSSGWSGGGRRYDTYFTNWQTG